MTSTCRHPATGCRRYFEEYLDALLALFSGEPVDVDGEYITVRGALCHPPPVQQSHPPIVIGTGGELMRRLTGRKADTWNCPAQLVPGLEAGRAVVDEAAGDRTVRATVQVPIAVGRDRTEADAAVALGVVHMAWMGDLEAIGITGTIDEATTKVAEYRDPGADGVIGVVPGSRQRPRLHRRIR